MGTVTEGVRELAGMIRADGVRLHARAWVPDGAERPAEAVASGSSASGLPDVTAASTASSAPLVFLHGFAQSSASWDAVAPVLARDLGRPVIALDALGHGGSDRPDADAPYAYGAQARQIAGAIREVAGCAGAAPVIVGYSMGGRLALGAVLAEGAPCAGLVLESAGLGPVDAEARDRARAVALGNARRMADLGLPRFFDWWEGLPLFASQRDLPAAARTRVRAGRLANDAAALERVLRLAGQDRMPDFRPALAAAPFPVLYLAGARDAKYAAIGRSSGDGSQMNTLVAGGEKRSFGTRPQMNALVVEGAGHDVHLEDPAAFIEAVEGFAQGIG